MVLLCVELGKVGSKSVHTCAMACWHGSSILRVEHATPVLGDKHQVDVQVVDDAATAPNVGVGFRQGCRRPTLRCGP
jgi:hypothetical protein